MFSSHFKLNPEGTVLIKDIILLLDQYGSPGQEQCPFNLQYIFTALQTYEHQVTPERKEKALKEAIARVKSLRPLMAKVMLNYGVNYTIHTLAPPHQREPIKTAKAIREEINTLDGKLGTILAFMRVRLAMHQAASTTSYLSRMLHN